MENKGVLPVSRQRHSRDAPTIKLERIATQCEREREDAGMIFPSFPYNPLFILWRALLQPSKLEMNIVASFPSCSVRAWFSLVLVVPPCSLAQQIVNRLRWVSWEREKERERDGVVSALEAARGPKECMSQKCKCCGKMTREMRAERGALFCSIKVCASSRETTEQSPAAHSTKNRDKKCD